MGIKGIVHGVADTVRGRHMTGIARAGAIAVGLAMTTADYLLGTLRMREMARRRGWSGKLDREVI